MSSIPGLLQKAVSVSHWVVLVTKVDLSHELDSLVVVMLVGLDLLEETKGCSYISLCQ
jgi:hypothetical protein